MEWCIRWRKFIGARVYIIIVECIYTKLTYCSWLYNNYFRDSKEEKVYSLDKICESNNDCTDNEICDSQIGICVCVDGYQLDDTKKFCSSNTGNIGLLGLNISGYDVDESNNGIPDQQLQIDTFKKVTFTLQIQY